MTTEQPPPRRRYRRVERTVSGTVIWTCPECEADLGDEDDFCAKCGTGIERVPAGTAMAQRCAGCDRVLNAGAAFCPSCGAAVALVPRPPLAVAAAKPPPPTQKWLGVPVWIWAVAATVIVIIPLGIISGRADDDKPAVAAPARTSGISGAATTTTTTTTTSSDGRFDAYSTGFSSIASQYSTQLTRLSSLSEAPRFTDPAWYSEYRATLANLRSLGTQARALNPPACLVVTHNQLLRTVASLDRAAGLLEKGLNEFDPVAIGQGGAALSEGGQQATVAASLARQANC